MPVSRSDLWQAQMAATVHPRMRRAEFCTHLQIVAATFAERGSRPNRSAGCAGRGGSVDGAVLAGASRGKDLRSI